MHELLAPTEAPLATLPSISFSAYDRFPFCLKFIRFTMALSRDEDDSPASPDPIPSDLQNASVPELIEYLEQLKMKLIRMDDQPMNHGTSSHVPVIPLNLEVPFDDPPTASNIRVIPQVISSNCPLDLSFVHENRHDDEEEELRKIAMMSLRPREIEKTPAVRSPSPMSLSSIPDDDCEITTHEDIVSSVIPSSSVDDEDAEALRLQALHSISKLRVAASIASSSHVSCRNVISPDVLSIPLPANASASSASTNTTNSVISSKTCLSKSHATSDRFIIDYGSESSSTSDSDSDSEDDENITKKIEALSQEIPLVNQSGVSHAEALKNLRRANVNLNKLTEKERREYLVLKDEITKLDSLINDDAPQLYQLEGEYRKLKKSSVDMKKEYLEAKEQYLKLKKQLYGAQLHERKMREAYLAASAVVVHTTNLAKQAEQVSSAKEKLVSNTVSQTKECLAKCREFGKKIEGDQYTTPSVKKPINRLIKLEKRKKKLEYRQLTLLQLISKRNAEEAQAKRRNEERRQLEENISKVRQDCSQMISNYTRNDPDKSVLVISQLKDTKINYYPDMLDPFFGRDSHRNNHPRAHVSSSSGNESHSLRPLDLSHASHAVSTKQVSSYLPLRDECNDSPLLSLSSFRLNKYFESISGDLPTSDVYCNRLDSSKALCWRELNDGHCSTVDCSMQHAKSYMMSELDKLVDIISFEATIAGVTSEEMASKPGSKEYNSAYRKMVNFAIRFRHRQPDEPFNSIAGQLIKLVRDKIKDKNILEVVRVKIYPPSQCYVPSASIPSKRKTNVNQNNKKKKIPFRNSGVNSNKITTIIRKKFPNRKKVKGK